MQRSIAVLLITLAVMACRHRAEQATSTTSTADAASSTSSDEPLVGQTKKVEAPSTIATRHDPPVGDEMPSPGAIINIAALVGRSRERVEAVLGPPIEGQKNVYFVAGQNVKVTYERERATWFEMTVPTPVMNAVEALQFMSIDVLNKVPDSETDRAVNYTVEFSGVDFEGVNVTKLKAMATKPQGAPEWTDIAAGIRAPRPY
jgi:hypothetical protein